MSDLLDPKKNFTFLGKFSVLIIALLIGLYGYYKISDQHTRDKINEVTSAIGFGTQVIPWVDRADTMSRKIISQNPGQLASSILAITHPSGQSPALGGVNVSKLNNRILVEITIFWKGGIIGTMYRTHIAWEISDERHESARVTFDEAPTSVSQRNADVLNEYFRTRIYPAFLQSMGT